MPIRGTMRQNALKKSEIIKCFKEKEMQGKVRLSQDDIRAIKLCFLKHFLPCDHLWLFGSRTDLTKKGGDIDLYIETNTTSAKEAIRMKGDFLWDLEQTIGEQKIDVVLNMVHSPYTLPVYEVAKTKGVKIA